MGVDTFAPRDPALQPLCYHGPSSSRTAAAGLPVSSEPFNPESGLDGKQGPWGTGPGVGGRKETKRAGTIGGGGAPSQAFTGAKACQ